MLLYRLVLVRAHQDRGTKSVRPAYGARAQAPTNTRASRCGRRVQNTTATGSTSSQRLRVTLTVQVTRTHFSAATSLAGAGAAAGATSGAALQVTGKISAENAHAAMGSFHTIDIEIHRNVTISKEDGWDSVALQRVDDSCVEGRGADVGAIVCGEGPSPLLLRPTLTYSKGTAAICLLSEHMTVIRQRIDVPVPRKRVGSTTLHEKGLARFYEAVYQGFLRHIDFASLRVVVIASPGFVKDTMYDYIFAEALRTSNKPLLQARNKFVRVHVNSPHVHSLVEVLKSPEARGACLHAARAHPHRSRHSSRTPSSHAKASCSTSARRVMAAGGGADSWQILQNARLRRDARVVWAGPRATCRRSWRCWDTPDLR